MAKKVAEERTTYRSAAQTSRHRTELVWVSDVLRFWFEELGSAHWFAQSDETDAQIRRRFLRLHQEVDSVDCCRETTPRALLAAVIVLDQFSRNLFRGTPRCYAFDETARRLSRLALQRKYDQVLNEQERLFLYMPFEHSENRDDQALAVDLIGRLGNDAWTRDAIAHQRIIERFGRFPHRNALLGRHSSAGEIALLQEPSAW